MAAPTRLITLNIGSQTIGLAKFHVEANSTLVLLDYRFREILADATSDETRPAQISVALREMLDELKIKHSTVNYVLGAQSAFLRFVKLPLVEEEKIERIVGFEAQQNVPFPIDEVIWDYQIVGGGIEEQIQVLIVAMKADYLERINAAVEETGLRTNIIGIATPALYNAFRYNYAAVTGCSLVTDIGARTTNLIFIEPGKLFMRSVSIGGSSITAAVAKEFGESFAAAEARKKQDGFVALAGAAEPADPDIARVSKIARSTMTRLHAEVMRSITHYRAQQQGNQPERIFLCGGGAGMPNVREFFHEKFRLPIEFFNPLQNISVSELLPTPDVARSAHLLGELVGLALRNVASCPIELSLLPAGVVRRQEMERRRPFLLAAAGCIFLTLLGWSAYYTRASLVAQQTAAVMRQKNGAMQMDEARLDKLKKQIAALDNVATPLITAVNDRNFWPEILEDLNARLPEADIWITELGATSGGKLLRPDEKRADEAAPAPAPASPGYAAKAAAVKSIDGIMVRGLYLYNPKQQEIVVDYLRNLAGSPLFVVDPRTPERVIKSNSVPTDTEWAFPYELQLPLRKPVKLL